jgi:hypothetical protein
MRVEQPVELMDIPETMFDFMGIKPTAYSHGQSLMPLMLTDVQHSALPAPIAFSQFHAPGQRISRLDSVRVGDWKLIHDLISGTDELFDLDADPGERRNLSHTNPSQLAFMRRWLDTCSVVVRDESGEIDIVDLPDNAILAALEKLDATAAQTAIGRLIVAGRVEPLLPFLTRLITAGVGLKRCQLALRYVAAAGYEPALPQIIALLSEQPDFEKAAALALGHYHGDVIVTALQARIAHHGKGAPWWLHVAMGLQGVSSAEAPLIAFVPHIEDADAEYYRALALAVLRVDRGDPIDTGILETAGLKRDLQMVGLSVSSRFPADDLLPGVYDAVRRTTIPFEVLTRLIEMLRHYPLQAVAPIYRALADQHDPSVRDRAKAEIATLETPLKEDWGTVTKEFWDDAAKGRVSMRTPKDVGVDLTRYQERLRSFRKHLMQPALLQLTSARDLPTSLRVGTLLALPLTVACLADGGATLGGATDSSLLFQVSVRHSGELKSQSMTNFRLPIAGLLPGESTHCLPLIRVPAVPVGPGYEVVIRARAAAPFAVNCDELVFAVTIR